MNLKWYLVLSQGSCIQVIRKKKTKTQLVAQGCHKFTTTAFSDFAEKFELHSLT